MTKARKTLALLAAALIAVSTSTTSAFAENITQNEYEQRNDKKVESVEEYATKVISNHLYSQQCKYEDLQLSNIFDIYYPNGTASDYYVGFVTSNEKIIGELAIKHEDDTFYSSFGYTSYPIVDKYINSGEPVAFVANGAELAITNGKNYETIYTDPYEVPFMDMKDCVTALNKCGAYLSTIDEKFDIEIASISSYSATYHSNVSIVPNSTTYNSSGQCWASCVASKAMKENNVWGTLTSDIVYHGVELAYGSVGSGKTRYQRGIGKYCGGAANTNTTEEVFGFSTVQSKTNGNVIIMRVVNTSDSTKKHAIILEGYDITDLITGSTYTIMDPNKTSYKTIDIGYAQYAIGQNVQYVASTATTYKWFDSMYRA